MSEDEIIKFQQRAKASAKRHGYPELADDFAQELILHWLEGRGRHQTIDQFFIDYLRKSYGDSRTPGGNARIKAERGACSIDEARNIAANPRHELPDWSFTDVLRADELSLFTACSLEEMNLKEVGYLQGVSESRVCQKMKVIKDKLKDTYEISEIYEEYLYDPEFSKLRVNWIKL